MAFIWRRRSTSIVKIVAILTAIWFTVAFFIYSDDSRRSSVGNKWNAFSLKSVGGNRGAPAAGSAGAVNAELEGFEAGNGYGVGNNIVETVIDANKRHRVGDNDAVPIEGPEDAGGANNEDIDEVPAGDESIAHNVVVHPREKLHGGKLIAGNKPSRKQQPVVAEDDKNVLDAPAAVEDAPGEMGKPFILPANMSVEVKKIVDEGWTNNAFNQYASDLISVHRSLPDPRDAWCKEPNRYQEDLPTTDVIVCFHNEAWSVLLRTVHSILDRSPKHLIGHIILVDDFSDMPHTKQQLEEYFKAYPKVKILRAPKREGLIRARLLGARHATSPVLTYLDSHCECTEGWLEPLLDRIAKNSTTVVCPVIDVIDDATMEYHYRDSGGVNVGGFDWNLQFNWHGVPERERKRHKGYIQSSKKPQLSTYYAKIMVVNFRQQRK